MLSMTCIILLLLLAVKCCKMTDSQQSELQYVDYIEDWHTATVHGKNLAYLRGGIHVSYNIISLYVTFLCHCLAFLLVTF
jgi:hypothetical protein